MISSEPGFCVADIDRETPKDAFAAMTQELLHPSALIEPGAILGEGVAVGAFCVIRSGAVIGAGCHIASHVVIEGCVTLGEGVSVSPFAVLGGDPQDYSFDASIRSGVRIGARTRIREGVTVHRATKPGVDTVVGADGMLMANSHVAHDAVLGDHVTLANGALIAGHVRVEDRVFVSGNCAIHQFCRIGEMSMCGGGTIVTDDLPPYCIAVERNRVAGLNVVGLRRRGLSREAIAEIRAAYRRVYLSDSLNLVENARAALEGGLGVTPEGRKFLEFFTVEARRHRFCRPLKTGGYESAEA